MGRNKDLCEEVLYLILARLSVKTLLRLRSVSKTWRSIIDDPYFGSMHHKQYNNGSHYDKTRLISLQITRDGLGSKFSLRSLDTLIETAQLGHCDDEVYTILGSCLGLILIQSYPPDPGEIRLWNPSVRKSIVIPPCPFTCWKLRYALGFSTWTSCFKVAAFQVNVKYGKPLIAVYTVGDDDWKIITHDDSVPIQLLKNVGRQKPLWCILATPLIDAPYLKPLLFFQGAGYFTGGEHSIETHLMSFDFNTHKFKTCVELPDAGALIPGPQFLFLLGEELALMRFTRSKRRVWVLNKDDAPWTWTLQFSCGARRDGWRMWSYRKVFYIDNGGTTFTHGNTSYDIATDKMRELVHLTDDDIFDLEFYMQNLALSKQGHAFP